LKQGPQTAAVTFSATSVPTPTAVSEPTSLGIFAIVLLVMGWSYKRRRRFWRGPAAA